MTNGYALGQLSRAFLTATTNEDAAVRRRADQRARRWAHVIEAMADGDVEVGSRTPARGLPAWVTLEVLHGGFATGRAVAETPIEADEVATAKRVGIHPERRLIFGHYLTDDGLAELNELLDSGSYRVEVPEDAALLIVAWLLRVGDRSSALDLIDAIAPLASRLRFAPKVAAAPTTPADHVYRWTAAEAGAALRGRRQQRRVETQREALTVWNPFSDRLLALWLEVAPAGEVEQRPSGDWSDRARALVEEYDRLAVVHTRCTKHRNPKENLAIQVSALRSIVATGRLDDRQRGLLRTSVVASVAKRGAPGTVAHEALREAQRVVALAPGHGQLAGLAAERLTVAEPDEGVADPSRFAEPVSVDEAAATGLPAGSPMPRGVTRVLARAHAATVETLLGAGGVPSAEVLAALVPRISATVVATTFPDPGLARVMAANYRAFRRRRSLLLVDLKKQVQLDELPWVRAATVHSAPAADEATAVARRVGALALDHFPATLLPNPLVQELSHLLDAGHRDVPLVEELAADIFMGHFSDKFCRAAQIAASVVGGTLYSRYYGIDYAEIAALQATPAQPGGWMFRPKRRADPVRTFGDVCWERSGNRDSNRYSVATNGTVIEQAQILTTHNLAVLVHAGVEPERSWTDLAESALAGVASRLELAPRQERPLATVKDAAYAWRQMLFFLSVAPGTEIVPFIDRAEAQYGHAEAMRELLGGLREAAVGSTPSRPFLGWVVGRHGILDALEPQPRPHR